MNSVLQEKLIETFPDFEIENLQWGIETSDGWFSLLYELCEKLKEQNFQGKVSQIKEKFGGLRFYITHGLEQDYNLIHSYEDKSFTICEKCGKEGKIRKLDGWLTTLCEECFKDIK